ncbi:MAG: elongation factor P [Bacteroidota bacterium]|nr:elongation factor P [Bacteroidota bacterium]MDE2958029.1 elongation factor P [Bacteroidota bacterium]
MGTADTTRFRNGFTMELNKELWQIVKFQHVKPGKGGAFVRTTLRNVRTGRVVDRTFRAGEKVIEARVERRAHQYLYQDGFGMHFMNMEDFSQVMLPAEQVSKRKYLKEGGMIDILFHAQTEQPVLAELAKSVDLEVVRSDPGIKGDTATGATKTATLESGAEINVPLFVSQGDIVRVNTDTGDYITRVSAA